MQQYQCASCAWKDLELGRVFRGRVEPKEVCLYSKPVFPKAKDCDGYQPEIRSNGDDD